MDGSKSLSSDTGTGLLGLAAGFHGGIIAQAFVYVNGSGLDCES